MGVSVTTPAAMVVATPDGEYRRFVKRTKTHHFRSDRPLTPKEVELFRVSPDSFFQYCAQPGDAPCAA